MIFMQVHAPTAPEVGKPAPLVEFRTLQGSALKLDSLKGKIVVLTFTSYTCPPCRALEPKLEELAELNPDVVFLNISVDKPENLPKLAQLRKKKDDPTQLVQDIYNADRSKMAVWQFGDVATPTMFVIDRQGRMASRGSLEGIEGLARLQYRIEWARKRKD